MTHPVDNNSSFTTSVRLLLREYGWYESNGWREKADGDRAHRWGLSEGQAVDELVRREWAAESKRQPC